MRLRVHPGASRAAGYCSLALAICCTVVAAQDPEIEPTVAMERTGCTEAERHDALRRMQADVLEVAPREIASMAGAVAPGGVLEGWNLSHGHVVLASAAAVGVDNINAKDPWPQLLLYAPSETSRPDDWLDFDGPDDPYRLVGWAYIGPYAPGSAPPSRRCIAADEWFVHEAGWHLLNGQMKLTPDAESEPERPAGLGILLWHPQVWDVHVWRGDGGIPTVAFTNPKDEGHGLKLPDGSFFRIVDGEKRPIDTAQKNPKR